MDKNTVLKILLQLEKMRLRVERKEIKSTMDDNTIRICQAEIASNYFKGRNEWTEILKNEYRLVY